MTLFDAEELISYWTDHPPVHLLLAAFMGVSSDTQQRMAGRGNVHQPSLSQIMSLPGVGRTVRPFSAQFAPGAVAEMMEMLKRFDASKNR
jgi:hypothetical protein